MRDISVSGERVRERVREKDGKCLRERICIVAEQQIYRRPFST